MKKIVIIAVNYKTEIETVKFIKELENKSMKNALELLIVDNGKSENSSVNLSKTINSFDVDCNYYDFNKNLGYFNGCLKGLEEYVKVNDFPDWVVISNTDIEIKDVKFFEHFLNAEYGEDVWCVAPSVINNNGSYGNPHYKERIPIQKVNRIINIFKNAITTKIYFFLNRIKTKLKKSDKQESQFVYSAHGCFFFLRKEFFEYLNGERFGAFLYSEESFVAEKILMAGKKVYYDSEIELKHTENLTTKKVNLRQKGKYISESMQYIKNKFYN